jgi:hypothetical protein
MDSPEKPADSGHSKRWPEFEAVLHEIEQSLAPDAVVGDPTAPWEGIADNAIVQMSGAVFKALCEITAQAEGAMEWGPDSIMLHSGMCAAVPLRFRACTSLPDSDIEYR